MRTSRAGFALLGFLLVPAALALPATSRVAVTPKTSTLGLGADVSFRLVPRVTLRLIGQQFVYESAGRVDDVDYDVDLNLQSAGVVLDIHPFHGGFHLSAGMLVNRNGVETVAQLNPTEVYEIGGSLFTGAELGQVDGNVTFAPMAPYFGVGWGNPFAKTRRLGFTAGLGLIHQPIDEVEMRSTNPLADPLLEQELQEEALQMEKEAEKLELYPVASLGLSIRF
jgi:hypothetical protein